MAKASPQRLQVVASFETKEPQYGQRLAMEMDFLYCEDWFLIGKWISRSKDTKFLPKTSVHECIAKGNLAKPKYNR